jgi:lactoylglutathione lyase
MKIEHVAMYVNDLLSEKEFFITYFNAQSDSGYQNEKTGFQSYFLTFEDGARLEIMKKPGMEDAEELFNRTGYAHLAFSLGDKEKVDELTVRMLAAGYEVISGPRTTGDGYYESCILDGEGNQIELTI